MKVVITEVQVSHLSDGNFNYQQVTGALLDENDQPTNGMFLLNVKDSDTLVDVKGGQTYELAFTKVK